MKEFLIAQKKKIEIDKWCEGCNTTRDPGQDYVISWIHANGAWFREAWNKSLCKGCAFSQHCGHNVLQQCGSYKKMITHKKVG